MSVELAPSLEAKETAHKIPRPMTKARLILILLSICRFHRTVTGNIASTTSEKDE